MNCRLFSQHENYTAESQIVKFIYVIMIKLSVGTQFVCNRQIDLTFLYARIK